MKQAAFPGFPAVKPTTRKSGTRRHYCGTADQRQRPQYHGVDYHRRTGTPPCSLALAEAAWHQHCWRLGKFDPDWRPKEKASHICGGIELADRASDAAYHHHRRDGSDPCSRSLYERNWYFAQKRAGYELPDWVPRIEATEARWEEMIRTRCGPAVNAKGPDKIHADFHYRHSDRFPICPAARREVAWFRQEKRLGKKIDNYWPLELYVCDCGPASAMREPSNTRISIHRREGSEPCGLALAEQGWWHYANRRNWKNYENYEYGQRNIRDLPHWLYRLFFPITCDLYWGITSVEPDLRLIGHWRDEDTPVGRMLHSGALYDFRTIELYDDYDLAHQEEIKVITAGNPFNGRMLNINHNPFSDSDLPHYPPGNPLYPHLGFITDLIDGNG